MTAGKCYERRKQAFTRLLDRQNNFANRLGNLRLAVFLSGAALLIYLYRMKSFSWLTAAALVWLLLFIWLVIRHDRIKKKINYTTALLEINERAIKRLRGEWRSFPDDGQDFVDIGHRYSYDLDIFGKNSLFQWLSSANTYMGRSRLAAVLSEGEQDRATLTGRQEAIRELAGRLGWRQRFAAEGLKQSGLMLNPGSLRQWAEKRGASISPVLALTVKMLPPVTLIFMLLAGFKLVTPFLPALSLLIQILLLLPGRQERNQLLETAVQYHDDLKVYQKMLQQIEVLNCCSDYLLSLRGQLLAGSGGSASEKIKVLSRIADGITDRNNLFYWLFDALFLLEYRSAMALEKWKRQAGRQVAGWLNALAEFESLASLAVIGYDHPEWAIPQFTAEAILEAGRMGHPLLDHPVCNDLKMGGDGTILLITGSNMSGKSTLLRTVGINLVLAYTGASVCASAFRCPLRRIYTSMRVNDDLEERVSSFYAELLRIKVMVEAANRGEQVFFLLDEIFKGTNSWDRHTGAMILIKQLGSAGCLGLISTHDLELGELEREPGVGVRNYHFDEYYQDNKIHFDYQLKPGISTTRNAKYLMKLAGINV